MEATVRVVAAAIVGALGASGLAGWLSGRLVLASLQSSFIPMAPLTALAFLILSGALFLLARGRAGRATAACGGALVFAASAARLAAWIAQPTADLEAAFVANAGSFGAVPLARVSPVTAVGLAAAGAAVMLLAGGAGERRPPGARAASRRDKAGALGAGVALIGATVLLGYAYGTPLLYGGAVIPVALPTGLGLALTGLALLAAAGAAAWPLSAFAARTARARLLRAFLPATIAAYLLAGAAGHMLVARLNANPAFAAALSALAAAMLVAALVWRIAGTLGQAIDQAEQSLIRTQVGLEQAVAARTAELARINHELEAFTSSVSHDLRAPLRHMTGFASLLDQTCREGLSEQGQAHVRRIVEAGGRMTRLIDDLLAFSRTAQTPLRTAHIELTELLAEVWVEAGRDLDGRNLEWHVDQLPSVEGDRALLRLAFTNLISNAIKYTKTREQARIHVGALPAVNGERVLYVRDNGVGFDMAYADKLFGVFQRLHGADQFEGTGIGLANVRRIVERHGGTTWAEAAVDEGATFFVSLPAHEGTAAA